MAFPYDLGTGFETGANPFTSSSGSLLDFPHYTELARQGMAPYRGSYCYRIRLAGGTTDQYLQEDTLFDVMDLTETWYLSWWFYLGKDMVFGASDKFAMVTLRGSAAAVEVAAGIQVSSGTVQFWWNETAAAASPGTFDLGTTTTALGRWIHAELAMTLQAGTGTIDGYIDGSGTGTQITTLTQTDILDGRIGVIGPDAGTSGTVLMDDFVLDDGRVYPSTRFQPSNRHVTFANDHPIVGNGRFAVAITGTSTDAVLTMYDNDGVPGQHLEPIAVIRNVSANEFVPGHDIFEVHKGLYTVMSGAGAQAFISVDKGGIMSQGGYVTLGQANKAPRS